VPTRRRRTLKLARWPQGGRLQTRAEGHREPQEADFTPWQAASTGPCRCGQVTQNERGTGVIAALALAGKLGC
jgi:hypothetical protein